MNAQLKQLIQKCNKLRRDRRTYRKQWLETNHEITRLAEESKRATWRRHLDRISKSKVAKQAWSTVCSFYGRESHTTGKSLLYKGRVYASDRAKAFAFVQEYAKISGGKSDKDSRKVVMGLQCPKRSTHTTTKHQIEEAITHGELRQSLSQQKAGKAAGPYGIVPDLHKHLSSKWSSVLLNILYSSWLSNWCPQSWRSAYVVPFLKNGKDLADVWCYRPIALTSTIGKVLERLIANRLSWWLEEHSAHSPWQAGLS